MVPSHECSNLRRGSTSSGYCPRRGPGLPEGPGLRLQRPLSSRHREQMNGDEGTTEAIEQEAEATLLVDTLTRSAQRMVDRILTRLSESMDSAADVAVGRATECSPGVDAAAPMPTSQGHSAHRGNHPNPRQSSARSLTSRTPSGESPQGEMPSSTSQPAVDEQPVSEREVGHEPVSEREVGHADEAETLAAKSTSESSAEEQARPRKRARRGHAESGDQT